MRHPPLTKHQINLSAFRHAFDGLRYAFNSQYNFKIHLLLSIAALVASFLLNIPVHHQILLIFAIILGLSVEMLNTAIESVVNLITDEWKKQAKIAKDVSAGMMLLTAIGTTIIATLILFPPFFNLFLYQY